MDGEDSSRMVDKSLHLRHLKTALHNSQNNLMLFAFILEVVVVPVNQYIARVPKRGGA